MADANIQESGAGAVEVLNAGVSVGTVTKIDFNDNLTVTPDPADPSKVVVDGAAGGGGSSLPVNDTTALVRDPVDSTKRVRIDAGAVGTGTTRVINMGNADVNLATSGGTFLVGASNLSDVANAGTARTNLGLGGAAVLEVGTSAGTVAAGDDTRITGAAQKSSNLSDLANAGTARTNLGLGTAAVANTGTGSSNVILGNDTRLTDARTPSDSSITAAKFGSASGWESALRAGLAAVTAALDVNGQNITNVGAVDGVDVSALAASVAALAYIGIAKANSGTGVSRGTIDYTSSDLSLALTDNGEVANSMTLAMALATTVANAHTFSGDITLGAQTLRTGVISPTAISTAQTDYNPTGLSGASIIRQDCTADCTINSLAGGASGRELLIINISTTSNSIALLADDGSTGTAANRIVGPGGASVIIGPGRAAWLRYDDTSSRWRAFLVGGSPAFDIEGHWTTTTTNATATNIGPAFSIPSGRALYLDISIIGRLTTFDGSVYRSIRQMTLSNPSGTVAATNTGNSPTDFVSTTPTNLTGATFPAPTLSNGSPGSAQLRIQGLAATNMTWYMSVRGFYA